ncbi:FAS-associated factor 1 [Chelonia mydas]|uniref:FAS-associated factor 1 n=1 Tax=Chelonia mydas TaxID=8469 RepID=M7BNF0_CHEMY|nr:FAS-associated factor 1 [Chelonia mydas]
MLDFRVEYRDRNVDVVLEDSCTVGEIKHILENELQIPVSKMLLKGWKTGDLDDSTVLKTLHLPKNNSLYVLTPDLPPPSSSNSGALQESLNQNFMLIITHREVQREYNLNFSGSSTIQENKGSGELVTQFVVALRKLSKHCQFGQTLSDALCDQLVSGLCNDQVRKKLLTVLVLTFRKAVKELLQWKPQRRILWNLV